MVIQPEHRGIVMVQNQKFRLSTSLGNRSEGHLLGDDSRARVLRHRSGPGRGASGPTRSSLGGAAAARLGIAAARPTRPLAAATSA